jgi:hypothetical protein
MSNDETPPKAELDTDNSNNPSPSDAQPGDKPLQRSTGPTTAAGKEKSRRNAITHGIFALGIIPGRESEADYHDVVRGMFEAL